MLTGDVVVSPAFVYTVASSVDPTVINNVTLAPGFVTSVARSISPNIFLGEQAYYPDADSLVGQWLNEAGLGVNLWQSIDETTPNDSDYIKSPEDPGSAIYRATLEDPDDPETDFGHKVKYRYRKDPLAEIGAVNVKVRLKEDTTTIAEWTHTDVSTSWTNQEQTLTTEQADSITDYSALLCEIEAY